MINFEHLEFSSHRVQLVAFRVLEREGKFSVNTCGQLPLISRKNETQRTINYEEGECSKRILTSQYVHQV